MLRRSLARTVRAVAPLVASLALASTIGTAPLAAQIAPGSSFTFTGVANAFDLGTPGVRLDFVVPNTVDPTSVSRGFKSLDTSSPLSFAMAPFIVGAGPQRIPSLFTLGAYTFNLSGLQSSGYGFDGCLAPTPEIGQRCTPLQLPLANQPPVPIEEIVPSPFYLENIASGDPANPIASYIAFDFFGTVSGPGGQLNEFRGTIGAFAPVDFVTVLRSLEGASVDGEPFFIPFTGTIVTGERVNRNFSVGNDLELTPTTTTPEPTTWALVGLGLTGVGVMARRRRA